MSTSCIVTYEPERITARGGKVDRSDAPFRMVVGYGRYKVPQRFRLTQEAFNALAESVVLAHRESVGGQQQ